MFLTAGIVAGTLAFTSQFTPLQPLNVTQIDNNTTKFFATEDQTIHLTGTDRFEIIAYTDAKVLAGKDNAKSIDVHVKKGQTIYIDAQSDYTTRAYKVNGKSITVFGNRDGQ